MASEDERRYVAMLHERLDGMMPKPTTQEEAIETISRLMRQFGWSRIEETWFEENGRQRVQIRATPKKQD